MEHSNKTSSALLISTARLDARRSVSKWRWSVLGFCLSFLPVVNVVAVGIASLIAYLIEPKIDLSTTEKVEMYSQHPALYTGQFRKRARIVRIVSILCGWGIGIICVVFFYLY